MQCTISASKGIKINLGPQMRCLKNHETASTFPFVFRKKHISKEKINFITEVSGDFQSCFQISHSTFVTLENPKFSRPHGAYGHQNRKWPKAKI